MKKYVVLVLVFALCLAFTNISMAANLTDVGDTKYEEAVNALVELGIVNGYPDNTFKPEEEITRAEISKLIVNAIGKEEGDPSINIVFDDVNDSHWASKEIKAAASLEIIVSGPEDGIFDPDGKVTYAEVAEIIVRAMEKTDEVSGTFMDYAESLKLFTGVSDFTTKDNATRGNVALVIWNMLNMNVDNNSEESGDTTVSGDVSGETTVPTTSGDMLESGDANLPEENIAPEVSGDVKNVISGDSEVPNTSGDVSESGDTENLNETDSEESENKIALNITEAILDLKKYI